MHGLSLHKVKTTAFTQRSRIRALILPRTQSHCFLSRSFKFLGSAFNANIR